MSENFPNMMKDFLHFQGAQQTISSMNYKEKDALAKLPKTKDKKKIMKAIREI